MWARVVCKHELIQIAAVGVIHDDVERSFAGETVVIAGLDVTILHGRNVMWLSHAMMLGCDRALRISADVT
jgi:hypothetical protein